AAVIDRGDPAVPVAATATTSGDSATDLAGNPRKSDGNGDRTAVVDIGAFEYTNHRPIAVFTAPRTAKTGQLLHFDGSRSHDPDGDAITFLWRFGDGRQSAAMRPAHAYAKPGIYTVRLVVTDSLGLQSLPAVQKITI